jgi:hypothetical protein
MKVKVKVKVKVKMKMLVQAPKLWVLLLGQQARPQTAAEA